ncbi:type IV secretion system protein VirD4 [Mycobacterium intracellulare]|uniref:type IV secretion system protein VirD4 n=1 Tax=Mycobacterium intracellulare TaxID=1767 RepID=UPI000C7DF157|nr:type IV secretion system protein VirD4 [Mycobacterium intracellulare]
MSTVDDPTILVTSPSEAMTTAQALLDSAAAGRDYHYDVWATAAVAPLAAMLYAASPARNSQGISWVVQAATTIDTDTDADRPSWRNTIAALDDQPLLSNSLERVLGWDTRQRDSVAITLRDALLPWLPVENVRRARGE